MSSNFFTRTNWANKAYFVNNVTYYSYFITAANQYLIEKGGLDIHNSKTVGFVVASSCEYLSPITYPDKIEVGLRVERLGNSSVTYALGIFKDGKEEACAQGSFTHVFVERASGEPVSIPDELRIALLKISAL